jgi:hypothetical protein
MWLRLAVIVGLRSIVVAVRRYLHRVSTESHRDIDVGAVSEGWLAEQRGSRKDRVSDHV